MNKSIKITSGEYRGRSIKSPDSTSTHPMGAREKLALFNMISDYIPGASVLDAFAGSGALGIEAVSRGACEATFIEKDAHACSVLKENLASLGINGSVFCGSFANFSAPKKYDIILADPPYDKFSDKLIDGIVDLVSSGGVLALSHPKEAPALPGLRLEKTRKYAGANISVYFKNKA